MSSWMLPEAPCWLETPEGYQQAVVAAIKSPQSVEISTKSGKIQVNQNKVYKRNPNPQYDRQMDLSKMNILNEPEILQALKCRYVQHNKIYTYIGSTLVSLNPFSKLPIYGRDAVKSVQSAKNTEPHIYQVAREAEVKAETGKDQAVIITGESGAGKTQSLKFLIEYLCLDNETTKINDRILGCNPVLQAFGNAQTVRNSNSSRFGKFIRLYYTHKHGKMELRGAGIEQYLLQKTRVVNESPKQSNYHIFSMLLNNMSKKDREVYHLQQQSYRICQNTLKKEENSHESYVHLLQIMKNVGFSQAEIDSILKITCAILNMGQIQFTQSQPCQIKNKHNLAKVNSLLSSDISEDYLKFKKITVAGSVISSPMRIDDCRSVRRGICKGLYECLFIYIVDKLNNILNPKAIEDYTTIGLLDIFGFECFDENSLEQLFINYANQKLQQLYIHEMFKCLKEQLASEDVNTSQSITFSDNQILLDCLEKSPVCLFDVLQDTCALGSADDETFLNKLKNTCKVKEVTIKVKGIFEVKHTARSVTYSINGFRNKNLDVRRQQIKSQNKFIDQILTQKVNTRNPTKFVSAALRKELSDLVDRQLRNSNLYFVRCIKPNNSRQSFSFCDPFVQEQVRYLGLLDTIKVRQMGFNQKISYTDFINNYGFLLYGKMKQKNELDSVLAIEKLIGKKMKKGKSNIFLDDNIMAGLNELLINHKKQQQKSIRKIEKAYIGWKARRTMLSKLKMIYKLIRLVKTAKTVDRRLALLKAYKSIRTAKRKEHKEQKEQKEPQKEQHKEQIKQQQKQPFKEQPSNELKQLRQPLNSIQEKTQTKPLKTRVQLTQIQKQNSVSSPTIQPAIPASHYQPIIRSPLLTYGEPNKEFHSAIIEQQLVNCHKFMDFCKQSLHMKHQSKDVDDQIKKNLSFRNKNLTHAMLKDAEIYLKQQSDFSFRCILKIMGQRKSRYSNLDNMNHLVNLMMGIYHDKDTGTTRNIAGAHKNNYISKYTSTIGNIEQSIQSRTTKDINYIRSQYMKLVDSPVNLMRDQIYLQLIRQFDGQNSAIKDVLELLTRYFPPSRHFILPFLQYASDNKILKQSIVRQNLLRFADCYHYLDKLSEKSAMEHLGYLQCRKSTICSYELQQKMTLNIQFYDRHEIPVEFTNQTLHAVRNQVVEALDLYESEQVYSLWVSLMHGSNSLSGFFVDEDMKVVDLMSELQKELDNTQNKQSCFTISLRIKNFIPKTSKLVQHYIYFDVAEQFKQGRFKLTNEQQADLASTILFIQRGQYSSSYRPTWLEQFQGLDCDLALKIQQSYMKFKPKKSIIDLEQSFIQNLVASNAHICMSHEFQITYFEVQKSEGGLYKKSAVGVDMILLIRPTYLLLIDIERTKLVQRIDYVSIGQWGLSKGKNTCLMIQTIKGNLKILACQRVKAIEEIMSEYIAYLAGLRGK